MIKKKVVYIAFYYIIVTTTEKLKHLVYNSNSTKGKYKSMNPI